MPKCPDYFADKRLGQLAVPIETLDVDPDNELDHTPDSIQKIVTLLVRFGWRDPVQASKSRRKVKTVIRGNRTLLAARWLMAAAASDDPDVRAQAMGHASWWDSDEPPDWSQVPTLFFADDDETRAAWRVGHNLSAAKPAWDIPSLKSTFGKFPDLDDNWGWSEEELEDLWGDWGDDPNSGDGGGSGESGSSEPAEEPPIPEVPSDPITKLGDVIQLGPHVLYCADCMVVMAGMADNSVDFIGTDGPYGLSPDGKARTWDEIEVLRAEGKGPKSGFMGKAWDAGVPGLKWARECLRILKPGGYLASFSSTRTYHRHACAIEDAGFDIIDQLNWLQWEGMPHGMNVSKAIDKAAGAEREVVGTVTTRFTATGRNRVYGDLDGFETDDRGYEVRETTAPATDLAKAWADYHTRLKPCAEPICLAQKPLEGTVVENIKKWGTGALNIGATRHPEGDPSWPGPQDLAWSGRAVWRGAGKPASHVYGDFATDQTDQTMSAHEGGRFPGNVFQYPKPSTREKAAGTDDTHERHTTVKPVAAMARLLRLGLPPGGGTAFEPFGGSGTTVVAACGLDCNVIACEMDPGYCDIIRARVEWALTNAKAPA